MCAMHLQERKICIICVGKLHQWDYWGSCTHRNLKGLHVIDQRVPASYEPSLFVANGDFPTHEWSHYFQAHVFPAQKDRKFCSRKIHKYRHVYAHKAHTHTRTHAGCTLLGDGCLNLSWHLIRLSFPWSFLWSKSDLNWLRRISGLSK